MAKKKKFLVCYCNAKKISGKRKRFEGINCTCDPYPDGTKKGKKYKQVFITTV